MQHPSFVYGAQVYPNITDEEYLFIATICFDSKVRVYRVETMDENPSPENANVELLKEVSIRDNHGKGSGKSDKYSHYDADTILEDDKLKQIMNPQDVNKKPMAFGGEKLDTERQNKIDKGYKSIMDKCHPNCLAFDNQGRLFVGDS
jgi:hypothetical protein